VTAPAAGTALGTELRPATAARPEETAARAIPSPLVALDALLAAPADRPHRLVEVGAGPVSDPGSDQDPEPRIPDPLVPGAIRLGISDFAGAEGPTTGRQPLPDHTRLTDTLTAAGIAPGTALLLYARDASALSIAARGWVTLRWAGATDVRVLRIGPGLPPAPRIAELAAWIADSATQHTPDAPEAFVPDPTVVATTEQVAARHAETLLVDARGPEGYGGAGSHIAGSRNLPTGLLVGEDGPRAPEQIRAAYRSVLGVAPEDQEIILSCGSGISASLQALALASAGVAAPVYIGSWSEWSKRDGTGSAEHARSDNVARYHS